MHKRDLHTAGEPGRETAFDPEGHRERAARDSDSNPSLTTSLMARPAYKRYVLMMMTVVFVLHYSDRGLMMLLLQPIKEDLQLSDTQLGLVTGIAFGFFYATLGVPLARWADRGNRVTITSLAIGLWAMTVMACMFVTNYVQLVFARIAAAVGESGCHPPTYSLIGDYFVEPAARTRAMAIYLAGSPVAALVSFIVGGHLNELYGWRITFFLMGVPGLIVAILVRWTIIEPRILVRGRSADDRHFPSLSRVLMMMWSQQSCRHLTIALTLLFMVTAGMGPWYAAFMMRSHGMATGELGVWLGLIFSLSGIAGTLIGGYVASRWFAHNEQAQMRMSAVTIISVVPGLIAFLTLPQKHQALFALVPLMTLFGVFLGPTYALLQRLVLDEMRATTMAVVMLLANLIGFGLGPQIVGIISDALMPVVGSESLRYAMMILSFIALWAAYHFWKGGSTVQRDLAAIDQLTASTEADQPDDLVGLGGRAAVRGSK